MKYITASLALAATLCAPAAWALSVFSISNGPSTGGLGTFSGTVTYDPTAADELTISITNTSPVSNGGFITGIAFNLGGTVTSLTEPFTGNTTPDNTFQENPSVAPYGSRDWGSSLRANWLGGGPPNRGVGVGEMGVWTFDVVDGPASLDYSQLALVVRFRGFEDGESDKVTAVPEPEAYALMLAGLGVIGFMARRRKFD